MCLWLFNIELTGINFWASDECEFLFLDSNSEEEKPELSSDLYPNWGQIGIPDFEPKLEDVDGVVEIGVWGESWPAAVSMGDPSVEAI